MSSDQPQQQTQEGQESLCRIGFALFRVLRSLVFRDDPDSPLAQLPVSQVRCLYIIASQSDQKVQDIARKLEVKLPAASQTVDRLVRRGLVVRTADPHDRRVTRLRLTEKARAMLAEAEGARQARMAATVGRLDAAARERVIQGLELLAAAAEAVLEAEGVVLPPLGPERDPIGETVSSGAGARRRGLVAELAPGPRLEEARREPPV